MRAGYPLFVNGTLFLASLLLAACGENTNEASPAPAPAVFSSMGTDFYLTLPDHLCTSAPALCNNVPVANKLILAAATATSGEVTFDGVVTPFEIAAGSQTVVTLAPAVVLTSNEAIEAKGIHVTALAPVSVHVISESATSADGYLAFPTATLGTSYYVMSYASARYAGSEFAMVATQDNTTISITPAAAGATQPAGVTYTIILNKGNTYQLANRMGEDMTGTLITANKPIAVFGGHRCAEVPSNVGYCDYLVEQIPDVSLWGTTHHTVPFRGRTRYTARVLASQDGTTVTGVNGTLDAGQFADITLSGSAEFISNKPVLVAQFIHSYADDSAGKGDPSMVLVTPTAMSADLMGATESTFGVHGLAGTEGVMMNIVTQTAALDSLKLNNVLVRESDFTPLGPTSIYSVGTIQVIPGTHTLSASLPYSALVYDFGTASNSVSYAYPVGATLTRPATGTPVPVPVTVDPEPIVTPACPATPVDAYDADPSNHTIYTRTARSTGHDRHAELHTGNHPHQHAHNNSHDGAHYHAHSHYDGESITCHWE